VKNNEILREDKMRMMKTYNPSISK